MKRRNWGMKVMGLIWNANEIPISLKLMRDASLNSNSADTHFE